MPRFKRVAGPAAWPRRVPRVSSPCPRLRLPSAVCWPAGLDCDSPARAPCCLRDVRPAAARRRPVKRSPTPCAAPTTPGRARAGRLRLLLRDRGADLQHIAYADSSCISAADGDCVRHRQCAELARCHQCRARGDGVGRSGGGSGCIGIHGGADGLSSAFRLSSGLQLHFSCVCCARETGTCALVLAPSELVRNCCPLLRAVSSALCCPVNDRTADVLVRS